MLPIILLAGLVASAQISSALHADRCNKLLESFYTEIQKPYTWSRTDDEALKKLNTVLTSEFVKIEGIFVRQLTATRNAQLKRINESKPKSNQKDRNAAKSAIKNIYNAGKSRIHGICESVSMNIGQSYHDAVYEIAAKAKKLDDILSHVASQFVFICGDGLIVADKIVFAIQQTMKRTVDTMYVAPQHIDNVPATFAQIPIPHIMDSLTLDAVLKDGHPDEYRKKVRESASTAIKIVADDARKQINDAISAIESIDNNHINRNYLKGRLLAMANQIARFEKKAEIDVDDSMPERYDGQHPRHWALSTNPQLKVNGYVIMMNDVLTMAVYEIVFLYERALKFPF